MPSLKILKNILLSNLFLVLEKKSLQRLFQIGEIDRFNDPKKLVAFAGVDPSVFESGKFTATKNRITKRGIGFVTPYIWLFGVLYVTVERAKQVKKLFLVMRNYESSMIKNVKK